MLLLSPRDRSLRSFTFERNEQFGSITPDFDQELSCGLDRLDLVGFSHILVGKKMKNSKFFFNNPDISAHISAKNQLILVYGLESVYVTIGNPAFCLFLYFINVQFRSELRHVGDFSEPGIKY